MFYFKNSWKLLWFSVGVFVRFVVLQVIWGCLMFMRFAVFHGPIFQLVEITPTKIQNVSRWHGQMIQGRIFMKVLICLFFLLQTYDPSTFVVLYVGIFNNNSTKQFQMPHMAMVETDQWWSHMPALLILNNLIIFSIARMETFFLPTLNGSLKLNDDLLQCS